jgi:hypothetical protein
MKTRQDLVENEQVDDKALQGRFIAPFTLEHFRDDICILFYQQAKLIESIFDRAAALRFMGKPHLDTDLDIEDPASVSYAEIRDSSLALSLEAMYRYAYHGEIDESIEELGPGGYHIGIAAIVRDMAGSSHLKFSLWSDEHKNSVNESIENCLRTVETANARLTLEGQPRFFNFDSEDEDYDNLIMGGTSDMPQGGHGAALTMRQLALLSGIGEMSIRTAANPKRPKHIPTETRSGRMVITIDAAKAWLKKKGRYVLIRRGIDDAALDLMNRRFTSSKELYSFVHTRLAALNEGTQASLSRLTMFQNLGDCYGVKSENRAAFSNAQFLHELADILKFPADLFALRVREVLLDEEMKEVYRELRYMRDAIPID